MEIEIIWQRRITIRPDQSVEECMSMSKEKIPSAGGRKQKADAW